MFGLLPQELLLKVHRLLPLPDLSSAILVNKTWRKVGEDPSLWTKLEVRVRCEEDVAKLSIGRLAKIRVIKVEHNLGNPGWEMFFLNVENLGKLVVIDGLRFRDLSAVEAGILARAMIGVETVNLSWAKLTTLQVVSIFTHLAVPGTKTKKLWLCRLDLSSVPSDLIAMSVNKVEVAVLLDATLYTDQLTSIFRQIIDNSTELKKLDLSQNDMSGLAPDILATAISKVKDVDLRFTRLSRVQLTSIFNSILETDTQLKYLDLHGNELSVVKDLFRRARDKLSRSGGGVFK